MEKKLLDLNAYGVNEMSSVEMRETNGGDGFTIIRIRFSPFELVILGIQIV